MHLCIYCACVCVCVCVCDMLPLYGSMKGSKPNKIPVKKSQENAMDDDIRSQGQWMMMKAVSEGQERWIVNDESG